MCQSRVLFLVYMTVIALGSGCSTNNKPPTLGEVDSAVRRLYGQGLHPSMNVIRSVATETVSMNGNVASVTASVIISEDDGTLGESCRNVMGCFRDVTRKCTLELFWGTSWIASDGSLKCQ